MAVSLWVYSLVFVVAFGLTVALTPVSIWVGRRLGIVALAGGRRRHHGDIVRLGGLGLYPAFVVAALIPVALGVVGDDPLEVTRLVGVLIGMAIVWVMGMLDDRHTFGFWEQLLGLGLASLVAIAAKVFVEVFNSPFTNEQVFVPWFVMAPLTIVWLAGTAKTVDALDGLDGLATGVTAIASLILFVHMLRLGQYSVSLLPLGLLGCCLGFLLYNTSPAKIFLGGGAPLLGYALATLSIIAGAKVATALLVLWLPMLDFGWQAYSRWRRGQPIGLGDRGHLHFRLLDNGWPVRRVVFLYYGITLLLGCIGLLSPSRLLKLGALVAVGFILVIWLARLARTLGDRTETGQ